jgi:probable HAF family extracellular repeat protein
MRIIPSVLAATAALGCAENQFAEPVRHASAARQAEVLYHVDTLPTLGGRLNRPSGINNDGDIAGFVNLPGDTIRHAAVWRGGVLTDLLTLGGENSIVQWPGIGNSGFVAGIAETTEPDTLNEQWSCTAFFPRITGKICRGFVWKDNVMTALPTLGGNQGFAAAVNAQGQVVGWAETPVLDPTCNLPQRLQFRAVVWDTRQGTRRELRPLPGDSTSAATAINEKGQIVGISGACDIAVGQRSARAVVMWDGDQVIPIGGLGGDFWHTPNDINQRGEVVGFSNPAGVPGITFRPHAFLWTSKGGMVDLFTLPGDATSQAIGINIKGQVVGVSNRPGRSRAFLYEQGVMKDLNDFIGNGFPHVLIAAQHINDEGVIVGRALITGTTRQVPVVATPIK